MPTKWQLEGVAEPRWPLLEGTAGKVRSVVLGDITQGAKRWSRDYFEEKQLTFPWRHHEDALPPSPGGTLKGQGGGDTGI